MKYTQNTDYDLFYDIEEEINMKIKSLELLLELIYLLKVFGVHTLLDEDITKAYFEELLKRL